jgi:very-short-patch-repair endonuclease
MKCANENGYSMIRIIQEDIFKDKYDWLKELLENINKLVSEKVVQNIYMCKNDEYTDFIIT